MSRFNIKKKKNSQATENLAGGQAYRESSKMELLSLAFTSFLVDKFYESSKSQLERMRSLLRQVSPEFSAKLAIYARRELGMRSITHVIAAEISDLVSGKAWAKDFYKEIVRRPDDMLEIASYHINSKGAQLTNAMKKGFANAFSKLDEYKIAKYRGEGKDFKMVDLVNLVHPKNPKAVLKKLMNGNLKSFDTWEKELSDAGSDKKKKAKVWNKLILEDKIGYFALLRNIRNILEQADRKTIDRALGILVDRDRIKKSLVLPFRFAKAYETVERCGGTSKALRAISEAADISLDNIPTLGGKTLVILDGSGSMGDSDADSAFGKGSLFAAALVKKLDADYICFANNASYQFFNTSDSLMTISAAMRIKRIGGGTDMRAPFVLADTRKYDRIILLSDMQGWVGYDSAKKAFNEYCRKSGCRPKVYSFDLNGYGTLEFPEKDVVLLSGWSEKVFDLMESLEGDKNALLKAIEGYDVSGEMNEEE